MDEGPKEAMDRGVADGKGVESLTLIFIGAEC